MNHPESSQAAAATEASVLDVRVETMPPGSCSAQAGLAALPREVWQLVLEHLTYQSVESCAAVSKAARSALCEALPLVTSIYVDQTAQLCQQGRLVKLLRGVRDVNICSFSNERQPDDELDDAAAAMWVLPFIRNFPALESLSFGHIYSRGVTVGFRGLFPDATVVRDGRFSLGIFIGHRSLDSGEIECIRSLLRALYSAFRLGVLPQSLMMVGGLYCPRRCDNQWWMNAGCDTCRRVLAHFPVPLALAFRHCLFGGEARRIVEARPGGMQYLQSEARLLQLLGSGVSQIERLPSPIDRHSDVFDIVRYEEGDLAEIERLAGSDHIDVGKIDPRTATRAIMRSFIRYFDRIPLPKEWCYIDEVSFATLKNMGLPIEGGDFLTPRVTRAEYLPVAIQRMVAGERVMQRISTIQVGNAILPSSEHSETVAQQLVDAGVLPNVVIGFLQSNYSELQGAAANIFAYVATSNEEFARAVVDAGVVPHLAHLLGSANVDCYSNAATITSKILEFFPEERDTMLQMGVADPLARLLKRPGVSENACMARGVTALERLCRADPLGFSAKLDPSSKPILRILYQLLFSVDKYESALIDTFRALCHLWSKHAERSLRRLICDRLLGLLSDASQSVAVREGASNAIQTIVSKDPTQAHFIINGVTIKALDEHVHGCVRERCLEGPRGFRLQATAPRLLTLLTNGDEIGKQHARSIINALVNEDPARVKLLIRAECVQSLLDIGPLGGHDMKISFLLQPLCSMLGADGSESSDALHTLALVLQNIRWNRTEAAHVLIDAGACHYMVKLLFHKSPEEQSVALIALFRTIGYCVSRAVYLSHHVLRRLIDLMSDDEFRGAFKSKSSGQVEVEGAVACVIQRTIDINGMPVLSNDASFVIDPLTRVLESKNASRESEGYVNSALRAYEHHCSDFSKIALAKSYLALNLADVSRQSIDVIFPAIERIVRNSVKRRVGALIDAGIHEKLILLLPASDESNGARIADYATSILDVNLCHAVWLHLGGDA